MIELKLQGLVGNNLFQYCVARVIAERLGYSMRVEHSDLVPSTNVSNLLKLLACFRDAPLSIAGKVFDAPVDERASDVFSLCDGYHIDLPQIIADSSPRRIPVHGFFERYDVLRPFKQDIRRWFSVRDDISHSEPKAADVVIHIRKGDFILFGRSLDLSFYEQALHRAFAENGCNRVVVCGVGIDNEVMEALQPWSPVYRNGTVTDDFLFMTKARCLITSQSTFSWWAAFLSNAERIISPIPEKWVFEKSCPHIDLRVHDESRYFYIGNVPYQKRPLTFTDVYRAKEQLGQIGMLKWIMIWGMTRARKFIAIVWSGFLEMFFSPDGFFRHFNRQVRWFLYKTRKYQSGKYRALSNAGTHVLGDYKKVLLVRMNHSYAGFFAILTFAINQILFCERQNCLPVVYFGRDSGDGDNQYFDENAGPNVWSYFFKPVGRYSYEDIQGFLSDPAHPLDESDVITLDATDLWYLHLQEPESVYAYPYGRFRVAGRYDAGWYEKQRRKAHDVIRSRIRVLPQIIRIVEEFYERNLRGNFVIGVHLRGTDKGAAAAQAESQRKIGPERYYPCIDKLLAGRNSARIFVATDQQQYLDALAGRYPDRVISQAQPRSQTARPTFQCVDYPGYSKGLHVLVDALLLARTDFLLKCTSHVGEAALWFNPGLPSLDLNYQSVEDLGK